MVGLCFGSRPCDRARAPSLTRPPIAASTRSASVTELGGVTVPSSGEREAPDCSPMLNQIVGLGVDEPATEAALDAALGAMGDDVDLLRRGRSGGAACRSWPTGSPTAASSPAGAGCRSGAASSPWTRDRHRFGSFASASPRRRTSAGSSPRATAFRTPSCPGPHRHRNLGWDCWLALDGDEPAAAAGVFIAEGVGYLGFAATLPEHRGKGGQNALLAERIEHARAAGCDVVVTETGELRDEPSLQLVPQHPPRRLHGGRGARQLAPAARAAWARRTPSRASAAGGSARPSASSA